MSTAALLQFEYLLHAFDGGGGTRKGRNRESSEGHPRLIGLNCSGDRGFQTWFAQDLPLLNTNQPRSIQPRNVGETGSLESPDTLKDKNRAALCERITTHFLAYPSHMPLALSGAPNRPTWKYASTIAANPTDPPSHSRAKALERILAGCWLLSCFIRLGLEPLPPPAACPINQCSNKYSARTTLFDLSECQTCYACFLDCCDRL